MARKQKRSHRKRPATPPGERDAAYALAMKRWEVVGSLGKFAISGLAVVYSIYYGLYRSIEAAQGKTTTIVYLVEWLSKLKIDVCLAWGLAFGSILWGWVERKKRLKERRERDERITKLECQIDPDRTSSGLTTEGRGPRR